MKTVGVIGGGQLGMMLIEEIKALGSRAIALDPNKDCSCKYVADELIISKYDDLDGLNELGKKCDVLTYEFENVPAEALRYLESTYNIPQGIKQLFDSQNRIREKNNALKHGLKTPRFYSINSYTDLVNGVNSLGYPCVYKTTTMGYDGHGQVMLKSNNDLDKVLPYLSGEGILEEFIKYDYETSVIMVRDKEKTIAFPMTINKHKNGILDLCITDDKEIFERIIEASKKFMESANYYGILTIEYFVKGDEFYFNEMAPRPHNSGHFTIEGCTTNQYRELARFLLDIPLEDPKLKGPTIMKNILGFDYENMKKLEPSIDIHIHDYHKNEVRERRKMAHVTFTNTTLGMYNKKFKKMFCEEE